MGTLLRLVSCGLSSGWSHGVSHMAGFMGSLICWSYGVSPLGFVTRLVLERVSTGWSHGVSRQAGLMGFVIRLVPGHLLKGWSHGVFDQAGLSSGWSQQVSHQGGLSRSFIRVVLVGLSMGLPVISLVSNQAGLINWSLFSPGWSHKAGRIFMVNFIKLVSHQSGLNH